MRNKILLFFVIVFSAQLRAQLVEIIIPGSVNNYYSKDKLFGATLYLVQDGITLSKSITSNTGEYNIVAKVNKSVFFELIVSKPNYITKKVYFDFKALTTRGPGSVVQAVDELIVELFAINKGVSISIGANDYAEKFTWDNDQKISVPDEGYKKESEDKIINAFKAAEMDALVSIYMSKADASARAQNFQNAIVYADSALTVKQNDSIILLKKADYQKGWDALLADGKKVADIAALIQEGGELIKLEKFPEATTKFNEVIKKDPSNSEAKKQLDIIKGLIAAKTSQTKDAQELIKLKSNADKLIANKKYSDAILELNKALKLSIPANDKSKIDTDIADLKLKIKAVDIEKQITEELKTAKKFDDAKEYLKSKDNYTKIIGLIGLLDVNSKKNQEEIVNNQLDASLGQALKIANELNSKSEYDKALNAYKLAEVLIYSIMDKNQQKAKLEEVKIHIAEVQEKRNTDLKNYNDAIAKVNSAIDKVPSDLAEATDLLSKPPLKNKGSDNEIIALKARVELLKKYYNIKTAKLKLVWLKDSLIANQAIKEIYAEALIAKVSNGELTAVKFSVDSLNTIVNKNKGQLKSNSSGITLTAPGILVDSSNASESFKQLEFTRISAEKANDDYMTDLKNQIDLENYFQNTVQDVKREESAKEITKIKNEIDVLNNDKVKDSDELAASTRKVILENELTIKQRELAALEIQEKAAEKIQKDKNILDDYLSKQQKEQDSIHASAEKNILNRKNEIDIEKARLAAMNDSMAYQLQRIKNQVEIDNFKRDSLAKAQQELAAKAIVKQSNYVESTVKTPNYIRDEKGNCFAWNALTERVYEIKNPAGFVVTVIVRRVVVDQYGYGVVFEHTRNEKGISSFTLNGSMITESIWFNNSSGAGVIIPNLVVKTDC